MFSFKQFNVEHDRSSMKVGTDSVLLGAWCDVSNVVHALDVGTGCGILSLMLAQRSSSMLIDAIDIDENSVVEARENFRRSSWANRLNVYHGDVRSFPLTKKYDLIVSNPPFFTNGVLPPEQSRKNARHMVSLSFRELLEKSKSLLADAGKITIVSPVEVAQEILKVCIDINLSVNKITRVFPVENGECKRILWELSKITCKTINDQIIIQDKSRNYTQQFKALCKEFYLKF